MEIEDTEDKEIKLQMEGLSREELFSKEAREEKVINIFFINIFLKFWSDII